MKINVKVAAHLIINFVTNAQTTVIFFRILHALCVHQFSKVVWNAKIKITASVVLRVSTSNRMSSDARNVHKDVNHVYGINRKVKLNVKDVRTIILS